IHASTTTASDVTRPHHRTRYIAAGSEREKSPRMSAVRTCDEPVSQMRDELSNIDKRVMRAGSGAAERTADKSAAVDLYRRVNSSASAPVRRRLRLNSRRRVQRS